MPATIIDRDKDTVGPFNRLSASQVNSFNSCPRLWYYEKKLHCKIRQVPVLFVGRAVEEAFCRMLKESPALISSNASSDTLSKIPLDENGQPDRDRTKIWPSQRLLPLPEKSWPKTIDEVRQWAISRLDIHLPISLNDMKSQWEKDERKSGDWQDVDPAYCRLMCINGLDMHLAEIDKCIRLNGGPNLQKWREGFRENWPSPDGFGYEITGKHPLSGDGNLSIVEAWEITRPWFVEPDAGKFSLNSIHPDYWFQGEYDLVYRWNNSVKIVDLKASIGRGDRSGDYVEQLKMYAMLWWITHGKQERVDELEIWYLGANKIKMIESPNVEILEELENELFSMWNKLKAADVSIEDCPPNPSSVRGFLAGGVPTDAPDVVRCENCEWSQICPGGEGNDDFPVNNSFNIPGNLTTIETTKIENLNPRLTIIGEVFSVFESRHKRPTLTVYQGQKMAKVDILVDKNQDGVRPWPEQISKGDKILVENAVVTVNWKGEIVLKIDPLGFISMTDKEISSESDLLEFRARWNVIGKLVYKFEKKGVGRNGKTWHRRGLMIIDSSSSMKISGWTNDWGNQYDMAEVGDLVLIANIGLDAWATQVRGDINRNSKIQIISST